MDVFITASPKNELPKNSLQKRICKSASRTCSKSLPLAAIPKILWISGINFFSPNSRRPRIAGSPDIPKQDFVRVSRSLGISESFGFRYNFFSPNSRRPRIAGSLDIPKQDFVRVSRSLGISGDYLSSSESFRSKHLKK